MDTDIRNYSYDEILSVLHIDHDDLTKDLLKTKITESIQKLSKSDSFSLEKKNEFIHFFNSCFHEVCRLNNFNYEYTEPVLYPGAVPKREPNIYTINTNNTKYTRGEVNPIQRETIKNTLIVSNKIGKGKMSTDFSVTLNEPLSNVVSLKVAALEIVNFYYNISRYLNNYKFTINTYIKNVSSEEISNQYQKVIELDDGYYNLQRFVGFVEPILNEDPNLSMIEMVYDELKGKFLFALKEDPPTPPPVGSEYQFTLDFREGTEIKYNKIGWYLGYSKTEYVFDKDYSREKTGTKNIGYNPDMALDFTGTKFYLLEVTDFNNNSPQVLLYNTYYTSSDILAKIPNVSVMTTVIFEDSSDRVFKTRKYFGPVKLQKLRIRLLDEFGKIVDMNGCDLSVTLELESLDVPYKKMV